MSPATVARPLQVRHLQIARAVVAAIAAAMITFSPDHSAMLGLSVFSGFAITSAFVLFASVWLVFPAGSRGRGLAVLLAIVDVVAGMVAGVATIRTDTLFFVLLIVWALASGVAEGVAGLLARRAAAGSTTQARADARDGIVIGALGVVFAIALLFVPAGYALNYHVEEAHRTFTLTGITIGVGIFGFYAAILAVYLGIAGFSPRADTELAADAAASDEHSGGAA